MESIENSLIAKMSQMTTDDRETLIRKFTEIISPQTIPADLISFYMDLANWNLSTALSVFYDQNGDLEHMDEAFRLASLSSSVRGCTDQLAVSGDHIYNPREVFVCSWKVVNDGRFTWPTGTRLAFIDGDPIDYEVWEDMNLMPDQEGLVHVRIFSPEGEGDYKARFQFVTPQNLFFGESIWVVLRVQCPTLPDDVHQLVEQLQHINQPTDPVHNSNSATTTPHNSVFGSYNTDNCNPPDDDEMME